MSERGRWKLATSLCSLGVCLVGLLLHFISKLLFEVCCAQKCGVTEEKNRKKNEDGRKKKKTGEVAEAVASCLDNTKEKLQKNSSHSLSSWDGTAST